MSRLTDHKGHYCFMKCVEKQEDTEKIRENCPTYNVCFERKMYDKLWHYEDLEEQLMKSAEIDIDSMVGEFMHYYNLQKENRLIELPCAVGDTVYYIGGIHNTLVKSAKVEEAYYNGDSFALHVYGSTYFTLQADEVFLTKEEAEKKLQELQGNE